MANDLIKEVVSKLDKLGHIPDLFLKGGLAFAGYQTTGHWTGALTALVGLKLAESRNLAAGAAGVSTLGLIGLQTAFKKDRPPLTEESMIQWMQQGAGH